MATQNNKGNVIANTPVIANAVKQSHDANDNNKQIASSLAMTHARVPKLRFKEFNGEWDFDKMNNITSYVDYRGRGPEKSDEGIFLVTAKNIKKGYIDYKNSKEYVPIKNYSKVMSKGLPKVGDILFTTEAPLGNIAQVDNPNIALAQRVIKLRGKECIENTYLLHYMLAPIYQKLINRKAIGTTVQGISGKELRRTKVSFPKLPEQQKIANFLTAVDTKLQQLSIKKETLEQYKKGVMQQLFSQQLRFKPDVTNTSVTARHEAVSSKATQTQFPDWEEKRLGEVCESIKSGKSKSSEEGNYPLYGSTGLIGYCEDYSHNGVFILIARVGANAGTINVVNDKFGVSDNTLVLNCKDDTNIKLTYYFLDFYNLNRLVFGSGQPLITGGQLKSLKLKLPCYQEQQKIATYLSAIDKKIEAVQTQISNTQAFKKGLLQAMFV